MASGDTKTEALLNILGNGGDASEYQGCCNTKTQSYILDAIDRVQKVEDDVEEIKNNPDVVDIVDTYADLQAYDTQHLTNDDIIRVLNDETHSGNSTYYRFTKNPDTWTFVGEISGGGGGPTVVQTTGTSTTDVMSQKAVTDTLFENNDTGRIKIGTNSTAKTSSVSIGEGSGQYSAGNTIYNVALGAYSGRSLMSGVAYSVALGSYATPTRHGEVNVGVGNTTNGYNNTAYRVIGGVHDGQNDHDAATVGQLTFKTLTSADYNWADNGGSTNNSIALWLLPDGLYIIKDGQTLAYGCSDSDAGPIPANGPNAIIRVTSGGTDILVINDRPSHNTLTQYQVDPTDGSLNGGNQSPDGISPYDFSVEGYNILVNFDMPRPYDIDGIYIEANSDPGQPVAITEDDFKDLADTISLGRDYLRLRIDDTASTGTITEIGIESYTFSLDMNDEPDTISIVLMGGNGTLDLAWNSGSPTVTLTV